MTVAHGRCLCGAVRFHGTLPEGPCLEVCHCGQCRRWGSGPYMSFHFVDGVTLDADEGLAWYRSSDVGERGFCRRCGSSLFWRKPGAGSDMAVSAGTLEPGAPVAIRSHIWVEDKPGWYDFADDTPRRTAAEFRGEGG